MEQIENTKKAYYYAYPIGGMYEFLYNQIINPKTKQTTLNEFHHTSSLSTAKTNFIPAPNNDTTYSRVWLDLRHGPVIIETPNTNDRYYSIQLLDIFSETIDNIGKRLYGTKEKRFAIIQKGWQGELDNDIVPIYCNSSFVLGFLRVLIGSENELPEVIRIQNAFKIYYLNDVDEDLVLPAYQDKSYRHFFEMILRVLNEMTSSDDDQEEKQRIKEVLTYDDNIIDEGCKIALEEIDKGGLNFGEDVHHWRIAREKIGNYGSDYFQRAVVWYKGALANVPEESLYPSTFQDDTGELLDGHYDYELTFTKDALPPVSQFWSLTMYIFNNGFLVDNPINRYSLGDRSQNLAYGEDGSLTIYIQHVAPKDSNLITNWLPSPKEKFYMTLRLYGPSKDAIDGIWQPPYVVKKKG